MIHNPFSHLNAIQGLRATMGGNPYHNQHIAEFTQCMEQAFNDNNNYYDQQLNAILDTLDALEKRVARLEDEVFKKRPGKTTEKSEADVYVTQTSLQKVRDAFLRMFR